MPVPGGLFSGIGKIGIQKTWDILLSLHIEVLEYLVAKQESEAHV